jgi:fatty acid amide hydrolase
MEKSETDSWVLKKAAFVAAMKQKWEKAGLDALITPPGEGTAFKAKNAEDLGSLVDYTILWNVLHWPAGTVPVTEVQAGEEYGYEDSYNDRWTKAIKDDMQGSVGMPLSV